MMFRLFFLFSLFISLPLVAAGHSSNRFSQAVLDTCFGPKKAAENQDQAISSKNQYFLLLEKKCQQQQPQQPQEELEKFFTSQSISTKINKYSAAIKENEGLFDGLKTPLRFNFVYDKSIDRSIVNYLNENSLQDLFETILVRYFLDNPLLKLDEVEKDKYGLSYCTFDYYDLALQELVELYCARAKDEVFKTGNLGKRMEKAIFDLYQQIRGVGQTLLFPRTPGYCWPTPKRQFLRTKGALVELKQNIQKIQDKVFEDRVSKVPVVGWLKKELVDEREMSQERFLALILALGVASVWGGKKVVPKLARLLKISLFGRPLPFGLEKFAFASIGTRVHFLPDSVNASKLDFISYLIEVAKRKSSNFPPLYINGKSGMILPAITKLSNALGMNIYRLDLLNFIGKENGLELLSKALRVGCKTQSGVVIKLSSSVTPVLLDFLINKLSYELPSDFNGFIVFDATDFDCVALEKMSLPIFLNEEQLKFELLEQKTMSDLYLDRCEEYWDGLVAKVSKIGYFFDRTFGSIGSSSVPDVKSFEQASQPVENQEKSVVQMPIDDIVLQQENADNIVSNDSAVAEFTEIVTKTDESSVENSLPLSTGIVEVPKMETTTSCNQCLDDIVERLDMNVYVRLLRLVEPPFSKQTFQSKLNWLLIKGC